MYFSSLGEAAWEYNGKKNLGFDVKNMFGFKLQDLSEKL